MVMAFTDRIADVAGRLPLPGEIRFARMSGSSIAGPAAAGWVTDFLNAAYFARAPAARAVDDLRLASAILTTRWARRARGRLGARDLVAMHAAFGLRRLRADGGRRGTLSRAGLLAGAAELLGDWFPSAYADPGRRAHGVVFPTVAEREAFVPERRLAHAALGPLTPPVAPEAEQHWASYPPVALPDADATLAFLLRPERWPDAAAETGRFTALRSGALRWNTFEIEVAALPAARLPVFTRGYVTCTAVRLRGSAGLAEEVAQVNAALQHRGAGPAVPPGARPLLAVTLTTHAGHFLGRACSRLVAYADGDGAWLRDVGSWDPLPWYLAQAYEHAGRAAQQRFWGPEPAEASMLAQMARVAAA